MAILTGKKLETTVQDFYRISNENEAKFLNTGQKTYIARARKAENIADTLKAAGEYSDKKDHVTVMEIGISTVANRLCQVKREKSKKTHRGDVKSYELALELLSIIYDLARANNLLEPVPQGKVTTKEEIQ